MSRARDGARRPTSLPALALLLAGCSGGGLQVESESDTTDRLLELSRQGPSGATHALRDHTRFDWDDVFYFPSGTRHARMEAVVGSAVLDDPGARYVAVGPLLVFVDDGVPVKALQIVPPLFVSASRPGGYSRDTATLVAHTKDPGPYLLAFVD